MTTFIVFGLLLAAWLFCLIKVFSRLVARFSGLQYDEFEDDDL